ncbi:MAG: hypothetical protein WD554_00085 [Flavobacteriaceae bacterium]
MKKMYSLLLLAFLGLFTISCDKDDDGGDTSEELVGQPGNPRFNLQFTNEENVDLDLYVRTPNGAVIYYGNQNADGGSLDVDCLCGVCPQGPNENIYWENGTAPTGEYEYWVEYYGSCTGDSPSSSFTLRVLRNSTVEATHTGSLTSGQTQTWSHTQN